MNNLRLNQRRFILLQITEKQHQMSTLLSCNLREIQTCKLQKTVFKILTIWPVENICNANQWKWKNKIKIRFNNQLKNILMMIMK